MSDNFHYNSTAELTTQEYEELEDFLLRESELKHPMNLDALDGFLTALIIGPDTIARDEWLPYVWGSAGSAEAPVFQSGRQEERIVGLIVRMMNVLAHQFEESPADYAPLPNLTTFDNDEAQRHAARSWCLGFIEGVNVRPASWQPLLRDEKGSKTIFAISAASGLLRDKLGLDEEKEYELWKLIPEAVLEIRSFWMPARNQAAESAKQPKAEDPGRNDLCPCGSGLKYKKCCGK
ncbi:hypothetical protein BIU88_12350 [Chlorobaculum limnaeum]|uniref:YecA family protein n=1 Tax=Chlorobaculum limnaeum TaxID=274537 RepID=A0A1D8D919_CHLLM|nr:UPF0149 family protein [Chlorobaculum limnaeum]AOS84848.1 hypothetical protein BIU88_12350 [Chlorobaculum limnaeum]